MENIFVAIMLYISNILHTELDFDMLQNLLIGNSVSFDHEESKLKSMIDNKRYLLSTIRKRKLRKVLNENSDLKGKKGVNSKACGWNQKPIKFREFILRILIPIVHFQLYTTTLKRLIH